MVIKGPSDSANLASTGSITRELRPRRRKYHLNFQRCIRESVDVLISQSPGRMRYPTHGGLSEANLKRVPLGTPAVAVAAAGTPFSHIKVVSQHSSHELAKDGKSPPVIFQKQSYSQETEQIMAAPSPCQTSSFTASLANNVSGTTFAAKARAAELNAVRSRKAAKEMETEDDVPSAAPVALGAIKFTKPRNRAKVWKPLGLDELPEESVHGDGTSSESTSTTAPFNSQLVQEAECHNSSVAEHILVHGESTKTQASSRLGSTPVPLSQQLQDAKHAHKSEIGGSLNHPKTSGEKTLLSMSDNEHVSRAKIHRINPQLASRGSSTLIQAYSLCLMAEGGVQSRATSDMVSSEPVLLNESKGKPQQTLTAVEETKLMKLGVLPPLRSAEIKSQKSHDDPFVEQPSTMKLGLYNPLGRTQQLNRCNSGFPALPAFEGVLSNECHSPVFSRYSPSQFPLQLDDHQHQRDPKPYTRFAANKKDMLLQNLHEVVASSKIQGSFSTATRTVLYDPAARQAGKQAPDSSAGESVRAAQGEGSNPHASAAGKESLKTSDPLPWTDRPVNIHDTVSPLALSAHLSLITNPSTTMLSHGNRDGWNPVTPTVSIGGSLDGANTPYLTGLAHQQGLQTDFDRASGENAEAVEDKGSACGDDRHCQDSEGEIPAFTGPPGSMAATQPFSWLMEVTYHNLSKYLDKSDRDYFGRYARVPEWCIDKSPGGDQSFFGDWGAWGPPPPRVGRDPRYRPTFHEGRYTVFEEIGRRGGRDGLVRRYH